MSAPAVIPTEHRATLRMARRTTLAVVSALSLVAAAGGAWAQPYPSKPITIVVPFAAGGASDITARLIGKRLGDILGTTVVVDNKPGANSQVGTAAVVRSAPDGHTLLLGTTSLVNNVHFYPQMPYDASRDLSPVVGIVEVPAFLAVGINVKEATARDFIAMARRSDGKLNYASAGAGSTLHLAAEWFKSQVGFRAQHIPQRGSGPAVTSLAAGETDFSFENYGPARAQMQTGRVRLLAIAAPRRFPALPDVPTLAEAGLPATDLSSWFVLMAPAGTPEPVIVTLNREVNRILKEPEVRERLLQLGLVPMGGSTEQLRAQMQQDSGKWGLVIRSAQVSIN